MSNLRNQTLNRLHNCDCHTPPPPFPEPMMPLVMFEDMMYKVAYISGYAGTKAEFSEDLVKALNGSEQIAGIIIQKSSIKDFPDIGREGSIYIDTSSKELYFWNEDGYYKVGVTSDNSGGSGGIDPSKNIIFEGGEI